jgi:hypothetical protein
MKHLFFKKMHVVMYLALFVSITSFAREDGGMDAGGGNGTGSSKADILSTIERVKTNIRNGIQFSIDLKIPQFAAITDPELKIALHQMSSSLDLDDLLKKISFQIQESPCEERNDASTQHYKGAPICISTRQIEKYSRRSLERELNGLLLHELAHQYGFNEGVAKKVQFYVVNQFDMNFILADTSTAIENIETIEEIEKKFGDSIQKIDSITFQYWLEKSRRLCESLLGLSRQTLPRPEGDGLLWNDLMYERISSAQLKEIFGEELLSELKHKEKPWLNLLLTLQTSDKIKACRLTGIYQEDKLKLEVSLKILKYIRNVALKKGVPQPYEQETAVEDGAPVSKSE